MTRRGDIEKFLRRAEQQGFRVEDRGAKWIVYPADPALPAFSVHKPHRKSGNPDDVVKALERRLQGMKSPKRRASKPVYYASAIARGQEEVSFEKADALSDAMKYCDIIVGWGVRNEVEGSFYLHAADFETAMAEAYSMWRRGLSAAGLGDLPTVSFEVQDDASLKDEIARPKFPPMAGVGEIAELLGVSRQRASVIARSRGFPEPLADLASGPVFSKWAIEAFAERWDRKSGRPRKRPA